MNSSASQPSTAGNPIPPISGSASPTPGVNDPGVLGAKKGTEINILSAGASPNGPNGSGGPAMGNQVGLGALFEGKMALEIIDSLLPALLVLAFYKGGMVVKKTDMQLTAKEKDTLAPVLQKCLDSVLLNFDSPWTVLAVTAGAIYGAKLIEHGGKAYTEKASAKAASKPATGAKSEGSGTPPPRHPETRDGKGKFTAPMSVVPDVVVDGWPNADPTSPDGPDRTAHHNPTLQPWGQTELAKVKNRRKKGHDDAIEWLNLNWEARGGVI